MSTHLRFRLICVASLLIVTAGCQAPSAQPSQPSQPVQQPKESATAPPLTNTSSTSTPHAKLRPTQVPYCESFSDTTYRVCDEFLTHWKLRGGLLRYGLPLDDWFYEVDEQTGETYRIQYFERHVIKLVRASAGGSMSEMDAAPEVPLGSIIYKRKYPNGAPGQVANKTGRAPVLVNMRDDIWLGGRFADFAPNSPDTKFLDPIDWFGMPISNEFVERNEVDGKEYKVQYFERAALEYHPENNPPDDIRPAPLGLYEFRHKYPNGIPNNPTPTPRPYVTPEPGLGCYRRSDLPPSEPTPAVSLAQAEANARAHYSQAKFGRALGPLAFGKHVSVDITGPQSDVEILRDAWQLSFLTDVPTPTPYPTDTPGLIFGMPVASESYMVYIDAETGQVLPGCEWGVIAAP